MLSTHGNLSGHAGHQEDHACEYLQDLISRHNMVKEMLSHPDFINHTTQERDFTKRACSEVFDIEMKKFISNARMWAVLPMGALIAALLYIFNMSVTAVNEANYSIRNLNNSVIELTVAVESMKNHAARLQQENDRNRDGIDKLREQIYRK